MLDEILRLNSYPENNIEETKHRQKHQKAYQSSPIERSYLKIPYISERLNHKIITIFQNEGIPIRIAHRSHSFRQAISLSLNTTKCTSTRKNYSIKNT